MNTVFMKSIIRQAIVLILVGIVSFGCLTGCGGSMSADPTLKGTVVNNAGSPIAGAIVDLATTIISTPDNGAFTYSWPVSAIELTIVIRAEGYDTYTEMLYIEGDEVLTKHFQLTPWRADAGLSGTLSGTVQCGEGGGPIAGAVVSIRDTGLSATTDASGRFEITNVPSGYQEIIVDKTGYIQYVATKWMFDNFNNVHMAVLTPE